MNNAALVLFGMLLGGFWTYWSLTILGNGLDWILGTLGSVFAIITLWALYAILRWRHYGRKSGAVCEQDRLIWRDGPNVFATRWLDLDLDSIGLLNVDLSENKYEHYLSIHGNKLFIFRPFVRMRRYEGFVADVLLKLKEHGRIPDKKGKKRKRAR